MIFTLITVAMASDPSAIWACGEMINDTDPGSWRQTTSSTTLETMTMERRKYVIAKRVH